MIPVEITINKPVESNRVILENHGIPSYCLIYLNVNVLNLPLTISDCVMSYINTQLPNLVHRLDVSCTFLRPYLDFGVVLVSD